MGIKPLIRFLIPGLLMSQGCSLKVPNKVFSNDKFTLVYPGNWQTTNEEGILNFFPKGDAGAVTISTYEGITFPMEMTRDFILEISKVKDSPDKVTMTPKDKAVEFVYEHTENGLKWYTKATRKDTDLFLLTLNVKPDVKEEEEKKFYAVVESFELK